MIKTKAHDDEINLLEILQVFFKGKIKIAIVIIISIICAIIINKKQPAPSLKAEITIEPLRQNQLTQFDLVNSLNIYKIDEAMLYDNYVDLLQKRGAIKSAIKKFQIINKENYANDQKYEEAVSIQSYKIAMSEDQIKRSFKITLFGTDQVKLMDLIRYIKEENNKLAIQKYVSDFRHAISLLKKIEEVKKVKILNQIKDIEIEFDLKTKKISQVLKFNTEDINTQIKNSLIDYELETDKRIRYLLEQALIARKLGISKINKNIKHFNSKPPDGNGEDKNRLYLMGYEVIDLEIQIIKDRKNVELWANNERLLKKKRELSQNKSVERKEAKKIFLDDILLLRKKLRKIDQNIALLVVPENIFEENLTTNVYNFEGVNFEPYATKFELGQNTSFPKILSVSIFYGMIIILIYLLIEEKIFTNRSRI